MILFIWERESISRGRGRGRSRLPAEQRALCQGLYPRIMTWAQGRCLTDWATQAPIKSFKSFVDSISPCTFKDQNPPRKQDHPFVYMSLLCRKLGQEHLWPLQSLWHLYRKLQSIDKVAKADEDVSILKHKYIPLQGRLNNINQDHRNRR